MITFLGYFGIEDDGKSTVMSTLTKECLRQGKLAQLGCYIGMTKEGRIKLKHKQNET